MKKSVLSILAFAFIFSLGLQAQTKVGDRTGTTKSTQTIEQNTSDDIFYETSDEASQNKSPEARATSMTERMVKSLNLTERQSNAIYNVNLDYINNIKAMREEMKANRPERGKRGQQSVKPTQERTNRGQGMKAERQQIFRSYVSSVNQYLDETQKVKFAEIVEQRKEKMKDRIKDKRGNKKGKVRSNQPQNIERF